MLPAVWRGAPQPPCGAGQGGGRAMPRQFAPFTGAGAEAKCDRRPTIPLRFPLGATPHPGPPHKGPQGGGSARGVSFTKVDRRSVLNSQWRRGGAQPTANPIGVSAMKDRVSPVIWRALGSASVCRLASDQGSNIIEAKHGGVSAWIFEWRPRPVSDQCLGRYDGLQPVPPPPDASSFSKHFSTLRDESGWTRRASAQ